MNIEIKIDNYTKTLLTIKTVCLLIITIQLVIYIDGSHLTVDDNTDDIKYILLESGEYIATGVIDVNIRQVGGRGVGWGGPIDVQIK